MKIRFAFMAGLLMLACNTPSKQAATGLDTTRSSAADSAVKAEQLITPGKSIGHLAIGMPVDSAIARLGRPDSSDAAMGSALMSWYSKDAGRHRTAIFAGRNMGNEDISRIKRMMVNSPWFRTKDGITTGATLDDIEKNYKLKQVDAPQKGLLIFDDNEQGITFDMDRTSRKCVAITVHAAHEKPGTYINMH